MATNLLLVAISLILLNVMHIAHKNKIIKLRAQVQQ